MTPALPKERRDKGAYDSKFSADLGCKREDDSKFPADLGCEREDDSKFAADLGCEEAYDSGASMKLDESIPLAPSAAMKLRFARSGVPRLHLPRGLLVVMDTMGQYFQKSMLALEECLMGFLEILAHCIHHYLCCRGFLDLVCREGCRGR